VHDLRPLLHPAGGWQSLYYRRLVPALLRQCRHILTNSHYTAAQISATLGIAPERITPIALGVDHSLFCPRDGSDGNSSPYLLHVGQHYPHKNLLRLLQAFAPLSRRHRQLKLVLAGKPHRRHTATLMRAIDDLGLQARVQLLSYVSGQQLAELYRGALALVFPSLWEGYGLPILEAMACGTPVITSRGSGCQEAAQGCALLVDPWDQQDLARAMERLIGDGRLRLELQAQGLRRTAGLDWVSSGHAARSALEALL